jgi:outer membrane biosynthesis protein TonB
MTAHRLLLVLPALLLGCGGAAPPASAPASPDAPAVSSPPPPAAQTDLPKAADAAPAATSRATATAAAPPAGDAQPASATVDAPLATGITQKDVLDQVQKHADTFDRCVAIGSAGAKGFRAKVTLKATIGPSGVVNAAEVASSNAKSTAFDACVLDAFKKLTFPRSKASGATMLMCPLSFDAAQVAP